MAEGSSYDKPGVYEIRVKGRLGKMWSDWFEDFEISLLKDETILTGMVEDQAALHGVLNRVRDSGLTLVSITQVEVDLGDSDDFGGDQHPFEEPVRIAFEEMPVLEGAGFALVGIAENVLG